MKKVGIIIELRDGAVKDANYGMISCARQGGAEILFAFIINGDAQQCQASLEAHGVHNIVEIAFESPVPANPVPINSTPANLIDTNTVPANPISESQSPKWDPMRWSEAVIQAMNAHRISTLFGLTSPVGRELLPRIAASLDAPLVMDCIDVDCRNGIAQNYLYSGKTLAKIQVKGDMQVYGIRPNVVEAVPQPVSSVIIPLIAKDAEELKEPEEYKEPKKDKEYKEDKNHKKYKEDKNHKKYKEDKNPKKIRLIESRSGNTSDGDLLEADVIISGGRAMKNEENFNILSECARYLGAEVGASRVAVDLGWVPYSMQVGQTGEKVSPRVYIACGISGSVQHFAGMKMSGMIIAVNTNPNAAIMSNCDYFIEGDLFEVIPALTEALRNEVGAIPICENCP